MNEQLNAEELQELAEGINMAIAKIAGSDEDLSLSVKDGNLVLFDGDHEEFASIELALAKILNYGGIDQYGSLWNYWFAREALENAVSPYGYSVPDLWFQEFDLDEFSYSDLVTNRHRGKVLLSLPSPRDQDKLYVAWPDGDIIGPK